MIAILAAAAAIAAGVPDWCTDQHAPDRPRNIEDEHACVAAGVLLIQDRMLTFRDGPLTCKNAGKQLSDPRLTGDPPLVGDGYWVNTFDISKDEIRCHVVKIEGKTIIMR